MFVLVKSGSGGVLDENAIASAYSTFDEAFNAMQHDVEQEAQARGVFDSIGEWGCDYSSGHGFAGAANGPEYQIFAV